MFRQKLIVIILLLLAVSSLSHCNSSEEGRKKESLLKHYKRLVHLDTGVENSDKDLKTKELNNLDVKGLEYKINKAYNNLACGYVFSTLYHINLTHSFAVNEQNKKISNEELSKRDFSEVSKMMMATFWKLGEYGRLNEFWAVLVYSTFSPKMGMLYTKDVRKYLYTFVRDCKSNKYDDRNTDSQCNKELNSITTMEVRNGFRESNKSSLLRRVRENAKKINLRLEPSMFDRKSLYLNYIVDDDKTMKKLLFEFGMLDDWQEVLNQMREDYSKVNESNLPDTIDFLKTFQNGFVDVLELVMVQIVFKTTHDLSNTETSKSKLPSILFGGGIATTTSIALRDCVELLNLQNESYEKIIECIDQSKFSEASSLLSYKMSTINLAFVYGYTPSYTQKKSQSLKIDKFLGFIEKKLKNVDFKTIEKFTDFSKTFLDFLRTGAPADESFEKPEFVNNYMDNVQNLPVRVVGNVENSENDLNYYGNTEHVYPQVDYYVEKSGKEFLSEYPENNTENTVNEYRQAREYPYDREEYEDTRFSVHTPTPENEVFQNSLALKMKNILQD